MLHTGLVT